MGLVEQIPFCDFGEVLDPSSADVTAHVLELLGRLGYSRDESHVRRGLDYLWHEQEPDGAWFGRWGVNYLYGTSAVLVALRALGFDVGDRRVARAVCWLQRHQNRDGGWGESCLSYSEAAWRGYGPSTASQTAWATMGLLAAYPDDPGLWGGVRWLLEQQNPDGSWDEPYFTGTGFPGDFYIKYHYYRNYFPLLALARARQVLGETTVPNRKTTPNGGRENHD
jgi:squalene-hopene/tetraprenyl-beta-curcumene cyclase